MRSKALADAWVRSGGRAEWASASDLAPYAQWLGPVTLHPIRSVSGSLEDAAETIAIADKISAQWTAADGYQFGSAWQIPFVGRKTLLLLDDYGHGIPHAADFILNQNPSADPAMYSGCRAGTYRLMGPRYSLLRDAFLPWRGWQRQTAPRANRLLVTFGGTDPVGMTFQAIKALRSMGDLEIELVVGAGNPSGPEIERLCAGTHLHVHRSVLDMPALIASCDFALCAAGTTTLECAFLKTPQLLVTVADNQRELADALERSGAAIQLGWHTEVSPQAITQAVAALRDDPSQRAAMGAAGGQLVDGLGAERVVLALRAGCLRLRDVHPADSRLLWEWANDPDTRAASFYSDPIAWETHHEWFASRLPDPNTRMWIAQCIHHGGDVGLVRFALEGAAATISVVISPAWRGAGFGAALIRHASFKLLKETQVARIDAYIKASNAASMSAFTRAGFRDTRGSDFPSGDAGVDDGDHGTQSTEEGRYAQPEHFTLERASIPVHELV